MARFVSMVTGHCILCLCTGTHKRCGVFTVSMVTGHCVYGVCWMLTVPVCFHYYGTLCVYVRTRKGVDCSLCFHSYGTLCVSMVCVGTLQGCKLILFPWLQDTLLINGVCGNGERMQTCFVSVVTGQCVYK